MKKLYDSDHLNRRRCSDLEIGHGDPNFQPLAAVQLLYPPPTICLTPFIFLGGLRLELGVSKKAWSFYPLVLILRSMLNLPPIETTSFLSLNEIIKAEFFLLANIIEQLSLRNHSTKE